MKKNQNELIEVMHKYRIKCPDVAKLLNCKDNTARVWRCKTGMDIPDSKLELLKLKLEKAD